MPRLNASLVLLLTGFCLLTACFAEDLPPYKRLLTGEDAKKAADLDKRIGELEEADKYAEAIKVAEELLHLRQRVQGDHYQAGYVKWHIEGLGKVAALPPDRRAAWRSAKKREAEADRLEQKAHYTESLALKRTLLELRREVLGEAHPDTAESYNNVAHNLDAQGKYDKAEPLFRKGLDIRRRALGEGHPETAASYLNLAGNLYYQARYVEAEPLFRKALDIFRQVQGEAHPHTAQCYNNAAVNLGAQGKYAEAEPLVRKALDVKRQTLGEAHPDTALSYNSVASNLNDQGKYAEAEPLYHKALDIRRQALGETHPGTATSYNNVAVNLSAQGKYAEAEPLYRKALDIRSRALGEAHPDTATSYSNAAANLYAQGKHAEAEPLLHKALDIRRQTLGEAHPDTATSYSNVAANLNAQGKHAEAAPLLRKALNIKVQALGEAHPSTATSYNNVAANLGAQGDHVRAEPLLRKALNIKVQTLGEAHPNTAASYNSVAANLYAQGKYAEAEPLYRKALDIKRQALGEVHCNTATGYNNVAVNLNAQGKHAEAGPLARAAVAILEAARLHATTTGLDRASAQEVEPQLTWALALVHTDRPSEAWQALEAHFGRALLDDYASRQGLQLPSKDQQKLDQINVRLAQFDKQISDLFNRKGGLEEHRKQFEHLAAKRNKVQEELSQFAAELNRREVYDLKRIQQQLAKQSALIFWLDLAGHPKAANPDGEHWAFLLKSTGEPVVAKITGTGKAGAWTVDDDDLPQETQELLKRGPRRGTDVDDVCRQLHRQRFAPLEPHLKDVKHLIALPTPALRGIPLETLTDRFLFSYATSGTLLAKLREMSGDRKGADKPLPNGRGSDRSSYRLLALGDPVFLPTVTPLPGTRREVEAVAALFPQYEKLLGPAAKHAELCRRDCDGSLAKYDVIHFATHGITDPYTAFQSAIILSQTPEDNGRVTALEMKDWKLNAELVVLSACESGLGRYSGGDGYLGFTQALFLAGAHSIILSQWQVSDAATALLMVRFYENWLGRRIEEPPQPPIAKGGRGVGMSKAEALREAKHWLRNLTQKEVDERLATLPEGARGLRLEPGDATPGDKPFAHPYYWSAFIMIGDPN